MDSLTLPSICVFTNSVQGVFCPQFTRGPLSALGLLDFEIGYSVYFGEAIKCGWSTLSHFFLELRDLGPNWLCFPDHPSNLYPCDFN